MDPITLALVTLRGLSLALSLAGRTKNAADVETLASAVEAGRNVDAHMAAVAAALKSGQTKDWDAVHSAIEANSDRLQGG